MGCTATVKGVGLCRSWPVVRLRSVELFLGTCSPGGVQGGGEVLPCEVYSCRFWQDHAQRQRVNLMDTLQVGASSRQPRSILPRKRTAKAERESLSASHCDVGREWSCDRPLL